VVADDEREQGRRMILNFGHTFGHAIEAVTGYERFLHGEAVAAGMVMAMDLSVRLGRSSDRDAERVRQLIERSGLATEAFDVDVDAMLDAMGMDKKVMDGRIRLIVCDGIGTVSVTGDVPEQTVRQAIAHRR
jgi:3-dehydroquinate synthase